MRLFLAWKDNGEQLEKTKQELRAPSDELLKGWFLANEAPAASYSSSGKGWRPRSYSIV
jgi:hypothetical protein